MPDLGPNYLQRLLAGDFIATHMERVQERVI